MIAKGNKAVKVQEMKQQDVDIDKAYLNLVEECRDLKVDIMKRDTEDEVANCGN